MARGRPRSIPTTVDTSEDEPKQPKKRGRPAKPKVEPQSVHSDDSWSESMSRSSFKKSTKKRKSKGVSENSDSEHNEIVVPGTPVIEIKKRGRPKKNEKITTTMAMKKTIIPIKTKLQPEKKGHVMKKSPQQKKSQPSSSTEHPHEQKSLVDDSEGSSTERPGFKKEDASSSSVPELPDIEESEVETSQASSPRSYVAQLKIAQRGRPRRTRDTSETPIPVEISTDEEQTDGQSPVRRQPMKRKKKRSGSDSDTSWKKKGKKTMKKAMKKIKEIRKNGMKKTMKSTAPAPMKKQKTTTQSNKKTESDAVSAPKIIKRNPNNPKKKVTKPQALCTVPGCQTYGHNICIAADEFGPIGLRCTAHNGGPRCVIPGCPSRGERKVTEPDYWSDTHFGTRCGRHGGGKRCTVEGCNIPFQQMVKEKDEFGEPGFRCSKHGGGYVCSVPGCKRISTGRAWGADAVSKNSGRRCTEHMGPWACNVPGCGRWSETDVIQPGDEWYKEDGLRCALHIKYKRILRQLGSKGTEAAEERRKLKALNGPNVNPKDVPQCSVPGCFTPSLNECKEPDLWGEGGPRCRRHGGGRRCNVQNCDGGAASKILEEDKFGLPGFRCIWHGGGKRCVVEDCDQPAGARFMHCKELHGDEIGPQGPRCCKHACPNVIRERPKKKPKKKIKKIRIVLKNLEPLERVKEELKREELRREANRERIRERDRQAEEDLRQAEINSAARMRRSEMRWANKAMLFGCPHLKYKRRIMHRFMNTSLR